MMWSETSKLQPSEVAAAATALAILEMVAGNMHGDVSKQRPLSLRDPSRDTSIQRYIYIYTSIFIYTHLGIWIYIYTHTHR